MQRHQLGLIWGALVTAGGSINIHSVLGFTIFVIGLLVSYRSAMGLGMPGVVEQLSNWKRELGALFSRKPAPAQAASAEKQPT